MDPVKRAEYDKVVNAKVYNKVRMENMSIERKRKIDELIAKEEMAKRQKNETNYAKEELAKKV